MNSLRSCGTLPLENVKYELMQFAGKIGEVLKWTEKYGLPANSQGIQDLLHTISVVVAGITEELEWRRAAPGSRNVAAPTHPATVEQPAPSGDGPAVWPLVIEDMKARDAAGRSKYGVPLRAHNGRDALVDAYQEALDLAVYLRQAIAER